MAFFGVTLETIDLILTHPNADKLSIYKMKGLDFEVVAGKDDFHLGQKVLYFPVDSIISNETLQKLGLEGKLKGKDKNRVGIIKLRNIYSKGLITSTAVITDCFLSTPPKEKEMLSAKITAFLDVTKYEPPISSIKGGIHAGKLAHGLPSGLGYYDIEGADKYPKVVEALMYKNVCVSEKLEGSNISVYYNKQEDKIYVNTHKNSVLPTEEIPEPPYWKMARECGHIDLIKRIKEECNHFVAIFGEVIGPGVQGNIYRLKQNKIVAYDIKIDGRFICKDKFFDLIKGCKTVPILCRYTRLIDWLHGQTIQEAANGTSALYNTRREGIVITPEQEVYCEELHGRTILKQHSPLYLLKKKENR